jgi:hypothetical protein
LFENQYGGFATLCINRYISHSIESKKVAAQKDLKYDYTKRQGKSFVFNSEITKKQKVATRFLPLQEIEKMDQLFRSENVFFQGETEYLPVQILTNSINLYTEQYRLYSLEFEIAYL